MEPAGKVELVPVVEAGLPAITAGAELSSAFTTVEKEAILYQSKNANVTLNVTKNTTINTGNISDLKGYQIGAMFDTNLTKQVTGLHATPMPMSEDVSADIQLTVPDGIVKPTKGKRIFAIFELTDNGGSVDVTMLGNWKATELGFAVKTGKTYVLAYQDVQEQAFINTAIMGNNGFYARENGNTISYNEKTDTFTLRADKEGDFYFQQALSDDVVRYMMVQATISWADARPRCTLQFPSKEGFTLFNFNEKGISVAGKKILDVSDFKENKEYNVAVAIDWKESTVDAYLDGVLMEKDIKVKEKNARNITALRVYLEGVLEGKVEKGATAYLKNYAVYEGMEPMEIVNGKVVKKVDMTGAPVVVALTEKTQNLAYAVLDTYDLKEMMGDKTDAGKDFTATLQVRSSKVGTGVLKDYTGGQLFDLSLTKKVGSIGPDNVKATLEPIEVQVSIPSWILNKPSSGKGKIYSVVKVEADGSVKNVAAAYDKSKNTMTFKTDTFSATYGVVYDDKVVGNAVFLNTTLEGLDPLGGTGKTEGYVSESIDVNRMVYDYIKMPTQKEVYYLQKGAIQSSRFVVVQMKVAWEKGIPEMNLTWRDAETGKDGTLLRVATDGRILVNTENGSMKATGASLASSQKKYTDIAIVVDWRTHVADIYVDDMKNPIHTGWQLMTGRTFKENGKDVYYEFNYPTMFRLWLQSVNKATDSAKGVDGTIYLKDWTIYEGDVPRNINAGVKTSGLAKTGNTLFVNTIRNGLAGFKIMHNNNLIELRNEGTANQYIHMQVLNEDSFYTQYEFHQVKRHMVFQFKWAWDGTAYPNGAFEYKDLNGRSGSIFRIRDNKLFVGSALVVNNVQKNKYYDIAIAIDWETMIANVWVDGKLTKINVQLPKEANGEPLESIRYLRTMLYGKGRTKVGTIMKLKDFVIYEGSSPRKITKDMETSAIAVIELDDSTALRLLGNTVAMAIKSDKIYYNGSKHDAGAEARMSGENPMFPAKAIAEALGLSYSVSGKKAIMNGISVSIKKISKVEYISLKNLETLAKRLGKTVTYEERGFVVIGNGSFTDDEDDRKEVLHYLLYDRPSINDIKTIMDTKESHPSVVLNADMLAKVKKNYKKDKTVKEWGSYVIKQANDRLYMKLPEYKLSNDQILQISRRVYSDAQYFSMAYHLTGDMKYVKALYKVYEAAAAFPDWDKKHFLDTAEMMMAFSIGYDWLHDVWTPEQRDFLANAIYEKGLKPAYDIFYSLDIGYEDTWWVYTNNNWAAVCHGSILSASVAIYDRHPEFCADMIAYSIRAVEYMMDEFYPSGAWSEGPVYWAYMMDYLKNMISTMDATMGTDFGISKAPSFDLATDYYLAVNGPVEQNNYHDSSDSGLMVGHSLYWLADKLELSHVKNIRKAQLDNEEDDPTIWDLIYYAKPSKKKSQNTKLDYYLEDMELVSLRESFEDFESAWVSFHAGESSTNHGHLDTGSYVVDMSSERWAIDLGSDSYGIVGYDVANQQKTYTVYRKRPEGHNLYVINPETDRYYPGQAVDNFTEIEKYVTKSKGAFSIVDLTKAYERDVTAAKRGFMIGDGRESIIIRDEISLGEGNNTFYWFNHLNDKTTAEVIDKNTIKLTQNGQTLKLMVETNLKDYKISIVDAEPFEWSPLVDGQNANEDIKKIQISSEKATGDVWLQVKFIPWDSPIADQKFKNVPLAKWSIPDGELDRLPNAPTLEGIYRDGKKLYNFKKSELTYTLTVPYDVDKLPKITAKASKDCKIEIKKAKKIGEYTEIKVSWKDEPKSYRIYRVKVEHLNKLEDVYGYYRLQIYDHSAGWEQKGYEAFKLSDNDLDPESRWSSSGEEWVCVDLGNKRVFEAVAIAWWKGDTRNYVFDIEISDDGENFTPVLKDLQSNGESALYEIFLLDEKTSARYVRYKGYGNSENEYNSLTEFAILTKDLSMSGMQPWVLSVAIGGGAVALGAVGFTVWTTVKKKKKKMNAGEAE